MFFNPSKHTMVSAETALIGRDEKMPTTLSHYVSNHPIVPPFEKPFSYAMFGLGCFWGAEKKFWSLPGIYTTAVGYAAGFTKNPTYQEVCSGQTGHNEVVWLAFDEHQIDYPTLLACFWEAHNPTQGMQQGNDQGTQYRSGIYTFNDKQQNQADISKTTYQTALDQKNAGTITTEVIHAPIFYYAEDYHQQYLAKNPNGYCGLGGTGVKFL